MVSHIANDVSADGIGSGTLAQALSRQIAGTFPLASVALSDPAQPDIAADAQLLGLSVRARAATSGCTSATPLTAGWPKCSRSGRSTH